MDFHQVGHLAALVAFGLHHHALHTALVGEVVDIRRAYRRRQHVAYVGKRHTQGVGLLAVHFQLHLWCFSQGAFTHVGQDRAFRCSVQQFGTCGHQPGMADATAVLQTELETTGSAQAVYRWRQDCIGNRVLEFAEGHVGAIGNRGSGVITATF